MRAVASRKVYPLGATLALIDGGHRVRVESFKPSIDIVLRACVLAFTWEGSGGEWLIQTRAPIGLSHDPQLSECYLRTSSGALLLTPAPLPTLRVAVAGARLERGQSFVFAFGIAWPGGVVPRELAGVAGFEASRVPRARKQINVDGKGCA